MKHRWSFVWMVGLLCSLCGDAFAQGARDEARELARDGISLLKDGKHQEALAKLQEAESKFHAPTHLIYMARAHTALGNYQTAHRLYVDVLVEKIPNYAPNAFHEAQKNAADESRELEPKIAALRVEVRGSGAESARVTVDGNEIPKARLAHPIAVEPGKHRVEARSGEASAARDVEAAVGGAKDVALELAIVEGEEAPEQETTTTPGEEPSSAFPIGAGIAFGIGGAALVAGTVTGIITLQRADDIKASCTDNVCPPDQQSPTDDAKVLGNVSTAMFVIGGAGVALGAVFLILGATQEEQAKMRLRLDAKVGPGGLTLRGTF